MKPINYILFTALSLFIAVPSFGQEAKPKQQVFDNLENARPRSKSETDKFAVIHQLLAQGGYISAAGMLEGIYEQTPDDRNVISLLLICYTELKAFGKAEMLLQRQLEKNPNDYQFQFQLLEIYLKTGTDSLITGQIDRILNRFPGDLNTFQNIIQALIRENFPELGIKIIGQARNDFKNNNLFVLQMASLYETRQSYFDAVMEYFRATQGDSSLAAEADKKTAALIRYPLAPPEALRAFLFILDSLPNNIYALKYLSETYLRQGKYSDAFNAVIKIDSIEGQSGKELLAYIRQCHERKLYEQVLTAAEYVERMYPGNSILVNFRIYRAAALRGSGHPHDAIKMYRAIADSSKNRRDIYGAIIEIGNIYRYDLILYDSARICYDSVSVGCPFAHIVFQANLEKAKLYLVEGRLDEAEAAFTALKTGKLTDEQAEFLEYNSALITFFKKEFEPADLKFRQLMQQFPRGFYLNDALINSLIIGESFLVAPELLSDYAEAMLFQFRLMPDSMESRLRAIVEQNFSPLTGIANYKLAAHYAEVGKDSEALELIDRMEKEYPDDYFFPYCLKTKADIFYHDEKQRDKASEIYRLLLTDYGNYPFLGDIRKKLQELEGYRLAG